MKPYDTQRGKRALMSYANSEVPDQRAHPRSMIWTFLFWPTYTTISSNSERATKALSDSESGPALFASCIRAIFVRSALYAFSLNDSYSDCCQTKWQKLFK